jgi:hypothetical protein
MLAVGAIAGALFASPALAQVTLEEAQAYVQDALEEIPKAVPGYDINDRPAGWNEMILKNGEDAFEEIGLTPYGTYLVSLACDQDCNSVAVEAFDSFGRSQGVVGNSTRLALTFNGGGVMRIRISLTSCRQPQCYLAYSVTQLS